MNIKIASILAAIHLVLTSSTTCLASPPPAVVALTDKNMAVNFEVYAPWKILEGTGNGASGQLSNQNNGTADPLRADISVKTIDYKAGLRVAGQLVASWLQSNPPTPAKFVIVKSSLPCASVALATNTTCKGVLDGLLTIWNKSYTIDVPVEMTPKDKGFSLIGKKEIKFGEYGFGDPSSSIAHLNPSVTLHLSMALPPAY